MLSGIGRRAYLATNGLQPANGPLLFQLERELQLFYKTKQEFTAGEWYQASTVEGPQKQHGTGAILAVDPATGETKWRFDMVSTPSAGILATAGGLVFNGAAQGYPIPFDARTGQGLWKFLTGGPIVA